MYSIEGDSWTKWLHRVRTIELDSMMEYVPLVRDSTVLELGCGTGRVLLPLAAAGIEVVGLDQSPAMLAIPRQKLATLD